jgi:hypothetical protein
LVFDSIQLAIEILGVGVLSIFGFYAIRLLASFKRGRLEEGWRKVTIGAIVLVIAQFPFLAAGVASSAISAILTDVGGIFRLIGLLFLIFGFRAQYEIWRPDNKKPSREVESNRPLER